MAISNYESCKAEAEYFDSIKRSEERHIEEILEGECFSGGYHVLFNRYAEEPRIGKACFSIGNMDLADGRGRRLIGLYYRLYVARDF
jgi:hypothetical protein